jgi:hypothetical protein
MAGRDQCSPARAAEDDISARLVEGDGLSTEALLADVVVNVLSGRSVIARSSVRLE